MLIYSHNISPRLQYITHVLGNELWVDGFELTNDKIHFKEFKDAKINYSAISLADDEFRIVPVSLLFENDIKPQITTCFDWNERKAFFKTDGHFPFDIFAAVFYLLSRYEEYLPHDKDEYGRYAHQNSLAYKESFLHLPLIDFWLSDFKKLLQEKFPALNFKKKDFEFIPTYDIDLAWSYLHKGLKRNVGGALKDAFTGKWKNIWSRFRVLSGLEKDPYDVYEWLDALHTANNLKPYYFFLIAEKNSKYDKNISVEKKAMQDLILFHDQKYHVGIHPSWQSAENTLIIKNEILQLSKITGEKIVSSRQHYIRFTLPETYQYLIDAGVESDFSMGYGSINGFRASTSNSFYWYDLYNDKQTELLITPFCFMDANSFYEQKYSPQQAFDELNNYAEVIKSINGTLVTVWHNTFLGTDTMYKGWKEVYENFVKSLNQSDV